MQGRVFAGYYRFNANISFTFQEVRSLFALLTYLHVWFGMIFGLNSFLQRSSKTDGNRKFGRFAVVSKLKFEVKNL